MNLNKTLYTGLTAIILSLLLFSCNTTNKLAAGESLYGGAKIKADSGTASGKKDVKEFKSELALLPRPKPNAKILGFRYKLFFYNLGGIFRRKLGEPPVLTGQVNFEKNRQVLQSRLENRGFFGTTVSFDTITKKRETVVTYNINAKPRYRISSVRFDVDSTTELGRAIRRVTRRSRLRVGNAYDLDVIKEERLRIDTRLKNMGFFYFNENYILVNYDSTVGNNKVALVPQIKPETPPAAKYSYRIHNVTVFANYNLRTDTSANPAGVFTPEGYKIVDPDNKYKSKIFSRTLVFDTGAIYRRDDHNLSLSRLVDLGIFKSVKIRFEPSDTARPKGLDAFYYLSPTKEKSLQAQISALTKSNNANGTQFTLSWRNRSLFRGAELLTVSPFISFEKQISGQFGNANTIRYGADVDLFIPRKVPFLSFPKDSSSFLPKTKISVGYEVFDRSSQYRLNSIRGSYGQVWKESIRKEHTWNILAINYVKPLNITTQFADSIGKNITLARSIEQQFIIGTNYNFNYNSQAQPNRNRNNWYFNGNADVSGFGLKKLFGAPVSNYVRLEVEGRNYLRFSPRKRDNDNMLVTRLIAGVGYAYGSSQTMPFIKEFFIGGTNSIRAWRARSLGPGKYYGGNRDTAKGFLPDQPGDVKIEVNTEVRFKIVSIVRGALFVDAGNIWTYNDDTTRRPGAKFNKQFLNDFAVGAGAGLRFDIRLLVLRVDAAFPVRKPYAVGGPKWEFDKHAVINLAIGYPF